MKEMCRFETPLSGIGAEYARKETGFLTSCKHIWQTLDGKCGNLSDQRWTGTDTNVNQKQKHTLRQCIHPKWLQQCFDRSERNFKKTV